MASELFVDKLYPGPGSTSIELSATSSISFKTNGSTQLTIDSSGRLLYPNRPFFYARTGRDGDGYTSDPFLFNNVIHNVGGHFVTSGTGAYSRFIAPVSGLYAFQAAPGYKQTNLDWVCRVKVNSSFYAEIGRMIGTPLNSHSTIGGSITLKLNANDYVDLSPDGATYHLNSTLNYFTGYLLG